MGRFSYNRDRRDALLQKPKLPGGDDDTRVYYAFVLTKAELSPCKNDEGMRKHDLRVMLTLNPLKNHKDPNDAFGPPVKAWVRVPLDVPGIEGYAPPEDITITSKACKWATGIWGEAKVPMWPRYDAATQQTFFKGQPLASDEEEKQAQGECIDAAMVLWEQAFGEEEGDDATNRALAQALQGRTLYAGLRWGEGKFADFANLYGMVDSKPKNWTLKTDNMPILSRSEVRAEGEEETTEETTTKRRRRR